MENTMSKPRVVISACLNGFAYRYDGSTVRDKEAEALKPKFELITVCPEVSVGLGIPRKTIRLVRIKEKIEVIQNETGLNLTRKLQDFSDIFLSKLEEIDGFILKAKSPSCGVKSAKVFGDVEGKIILGKEDGIFARTVKQKFPYLPIIDERRLKNPELRWEFLAKVFLHYRFRKARKEIGSLIEFHTRAKYLFMSISQMGLKTLGKILAGHKKGAFQQTVNQYQHDFQTILARPIRKSNLVNAFSHIFGYVSPRLGQKERNHFLKLLNEYQAKKIDFVIIIELLRSFSYRFNLPYLLNQYLLFPED